MVITKTKKKVNEDDLYIENKRHKRKTLKEILKIHKTSQPEMIFLQKILKSDTGTTLTNPTKTGVRQLLITHDLKKKSRQALKVLQNEEKQIKQKKLKLFNKMIKN